MQNSRKTDKRATKHLEQMFGAQQGPYDNTIGQLAMGTQVFPSGTTGTGMADRPPPLLGAMTDPGGMGLAEYSDQFSPAGGHVSSGGRSPLVNRARSPYAAPQTGPHAKRHSLGAIHQYSGINLSPTHVISPTHSPGIFTGPAQRFSLPALDATQLPRYNDMPWLSPPFAQDDMASRMGGGQGQAPMLSRSRSFNGLLEPSLYSGQQAELNRARSFSDVTHAPLSAQLTMSPLISAFAGMEMPAEPTHLNQLPMYGSGGASPYMQQQQQQQVQRNPSDVFGFGQQAAFAESMSSRGQPHPGQIPESIEELQPSLSFPANQIFSNGIESFAMPKRNPSLTVWDVNAQVQPLGSMSQEIAAILAQTADEQDIGSLLETLNNPLHFQP